MSKHFFAYIVLWGAFMLCAQSGFSVPAYPYFVTVTQATGEKITVKMRGDERIKWMESEDGYSLLYNKDKKIVYAVLNEKGDMIPSDMAASDVEMRSSEVNAELKEIAKGLQYSPEQRLLFRQIGSIKEEINSRPGFSLRAAGGTAKALCVLIQFPDKPFTHTKEEFEQLMNQSGYQENGAKGSVKDFYRENSYDLLDLEVTVAGIYTAAQNWAYYGENDRTGQDKYPGELAREAANFAFNDPDINPADYDNDNDGYIDAFHIIFAGYGEEVAGADANSIWSHESGLYPELSFNNKRLNKYSCSPELRGSSGTNMTFIGVICHELGHIFGAPDFYDTDGKDNRGYEFLGTGNWDLMAGGSWNGNGATPAHINMYQKIIFGWVNPIELNSSQTVTDMPCSAQEPVAYTIKTSTAGEYFVLENRQKRGFDVNVPGHGLLIYHVSVSQQDIRYNMVNNAHPQKVYPVCASSSLAAPTGSPGSYGLINSSSCPFPGTGLSVNRTFNQTSTPAMWAWNKNPVEKPITRISEKSGLISFQFMETLLGLTAALSEKQVTLKWNVPDVDTIIKGYNVYRDNILLISTTETTYREDLKENGTYVYGVSILYENSESEKETISVTVNQTAMGVIDRNPASVYPNPIEKGNMLTIDIGADCENAEGLLYDLSGRLIMQKQIVSPSGHYPVNLPSGMYFLKIIKKQRTETFKLTVK